MREPRFLFHRADGELRPTSCDQLSKFFTCSPSPSFQASLGETDRTGAPILTQIIHAAYARTATPPQKRKQFHLYVDEFQRFATEEFALFLTQAARKFGIGTTIAHRYRRQLDRKNRNACLAAGNLMVFRVSAEDGHTLAYQFDTTLPPEDEVQAQQKRTNADMAEKIASELTNLPNFVARVRIAKGAKFVDYTIRIPKPTYTY